MLRIELGLAVCKVGSLPAVLSLQLHPSHPHVILGKGQLEFLFTKNVSFVQ